mmetsp:Transcript_26476/g.49987  ORF Transcript_26476/g.49987 Transcript_26476/m.49987 type:complete len:204 (+) Transcript_26476:79-690(+)
MPRFIFQVGFKNFGLTTFQALGQLVTALAACETAYLFDKQTPKTRVRTLEPLENISRQFDAGDGQIICHGVVPVVIFHFLLLLLLLVLLLVCNWHRDFTLGSIILQGPSRSCGKCFTGVFQKISNLVVILVVITTHTTIDVKAIPPVSPRGRCRIKVGDATHFRHFSPRLVKGKEFLLLYRGQVLLFLLAVVFFGLEALLIPI